MFEDTPFGPQSSTDHLSIIEMGRDPIRRLRRAVVVSESLIGQMQGFGNQWPDSLKAFALLLYRHVVAAVPNPGLDTPDR